MQVTDPKNKSMILMWGVATQEGWELIKNIQVYLNDALKEEI